MFGGCSSNTKKCTECYDGTNWSAATAMTIGMCCPQSAGCAFSSGLAFSERSTNACACTEEWTEGVANTMLVRRTSGSAYVY